ncbi:S-layer homology domain-containing protein [Paenibacillus radicis (ex Gao et al. 2016)]|uniref:DUF5011 domain-containing protein n=1 Tax=Paenibacillus radicis (ex Gao et al. 2016) TaxID=1737354 RepID=A0A917HHV4_9BACL|nr:S-layer homology domain-containing protein [Paenibacillus radicis (ex Gao et al. 2016)]GGG79086.1 hypothetical protein GCM10010918_40120 [Paenibacillus radicis (ex Gao et al. 2016)]
MKRSLSLLMALMLLLASFPAAKAWAVPPTPSAFISAALQDARALAYHDGYIYAAQREPGGIFRISVETGEVTKVLNRGYIMTVALNEAGDLFFTTDNYDQNIYKISSSALTNFPLPANSATPYYNTGFNFVYGLAFDAADNLYFTDYTTKGIYKLASGASAATTVISGLSSPVKGITISPAGNLYAIDDRSNKIFRIASEHLTAGAVDASKFELFKNAQLQPSGIAYLPNGKAYKAYGSSVSQFPELDEQVLDTVKPVITLIGSSTVLVRNGTAFHDSGVTVTDNVDNDLTAAVTYSLNGAPLPAIDTTVPGMYTITYSATDAAGNQAVAVTRTVIVNEDSSNLAYGVPVTVDKGTISGEITQLTDDSLHTGWTGSPTDAPWTITLDMGENALYNEILVTDSVYLQSYEVKVSDSPNGPFATIPGTIYAAPVTHTEGPYDGYTTDSVSFPEAITQRYIQIVIHAVGEDGSLGPDLQEIKVYNQPRIPEPSPEPSTEPTPEPSSEPTPEPSTEPTPEPSSEPTPTPTPEPTPAPGGTGGSSTPSSQTEQISVPVDGGDNNQISAATIIRTTGADGKKKDEVTLSAGNAREIVEKLTAAGLHTARVVIPDTKDEVVQVNVNLPAGAVQQLAEGHINLEIHTAGVSLIIPYNSLTGLTRDTYFRIIPIKNQADQDQVKERAVKEEAVKTVLGDGSLQVIGRPMTIETNLSSRAVSLSLPLPAAQIPANEKERQQWLDNLAIFIEHSDGERVVIKPEIVTDAAGQTHLQFNVTKFSTFTILHLSNWSLYQKQHSSYINGYANGSFRPEKSVSRAEIAAMLSRIGAGEDNTVAPVIFSDVASGHWAFQAVSLIQTSGLMKGFSDGTFKPNAELTRAEMAVIVSRWLKLTNEGNTAAAKDVQGHWAESSIRLVIQAGMMTGMPDGSFKPNQALTRAEAVAIFNRVLGREPLPASTKPTWTDVPSSHWAFGHIEEASRKTN